MLDGRKYEWSGTTARWANVSQNSTGGGFIELVTSPNNPDGPLTKPVYSADRRRRKRRSSTMPKPSGHAGSRLGWALIRDENVPTRQASTCMI
ncbi:unnamed protein product [Urochloa humidicola]